MNNAPILNAGCYCYIFSQFPCSHQFIKWNKLIWMKLSCWYCWYYRYYTATPPRTGNKLSPNNAMYKSALVHSSQLQFKHNNENILHYTRTQFTKSRCVLHSAPLTSMYACMYVWISTLNIQHYLGASSSVQYRVYVRASAFLFLFFIFSLCFHFGFLCLYFLWCWIRWCIWPTGPVVCAHKSLSRQVM